VYAREVDGRALTFSVSGMLWKHSLVMLDQETQSLWSHLLGEAMQGKLKGKRLESIPCVMTDWESWRKQHPDGTVVMLSRTSKEYVREFYRQPQQFVLGVVLEGKAKAWGFDRLVKDPARNDLVGNTPVLVSFDKRSLTARLYSRKTKEKVLTFKRQGDSLTDAETGSTWDPQTGRATAGPLEGTTLVLLPAVVSYRAAWQAFHPASEMDPAK
jgi:hypothetical protein